MTNNDLGEAVIIIAFIIGLGVAGFVIDTMQTHTITGEVQGYKWFDGGDGYQWWMLINDTMYSLPIFDQQGVMDRYQKGDIVTMSVCRNYIKGVLSSTRGINAVSP